MCFSRGWRAAAVISTAERGGWRSAAGGLGLFISSCPSRRVEIKSFMSKIKDVEPLTRCSYILMLFFCILLGGTESEVPIDGLV